MYDLKLAIKAAKAFTANKRTKISEASVPSIRGAYVTPEYVYATDAKVLIRIKHNGQVEESYNHMYSKSDELYLKENPNIYPNVNKIVPEYEYALYAYNVLDIKEWLNVHQMAAVFKGNKNKQVILELDNLILTAKGIHKDDYGLSEFTYTGVPLERIPFTRALAKQRDKISYSADYMVKAIKACKQLKINSTLQFAVYEDLFKPFLLTGEGIDVVIMPIKAEYPVPKPKQNPKSKSKPKSLSS